MFKAPTEAEINSGIEVLKLKLENNAMSPEDDMTFKETMFLVSSQDFRLPHILRKRLCMQARRLARLHGMMQAMDMISIVLEKIITTKSEKTDFEKLGMVVPTIMLGIVDLLTERETSLKTDSLELLEEIQTVKKDAKAGSGSSFPA